MSSLFERLTIQEEDDCNNRLVAFPSKIQDDTFVMATREDGGPLGVHVYMTPAQTRVLRDFLTDWLDRGDSDRRGGG